MRAINVTNQSVLVEQGEVANTAWTRLKGLIGHPPLQSGEGLLIQPCRGVHTLGMRFPIDVLYVDKSGQIVRAVEQLAPGHIGPIVLNASYVLELPAGTIAQSGTKAGDHIAIQRQASTAHKNR